MPGLKLLGELVSDMCVVDVGAPEVVERASVQGVEDLATDDAVLDDMGEYGSSNALLWGAGRHCSSVRIRICSACF